MKQRNNPINPQIIFEDSSLMIVSKPSGWVVNDANTVKEGVPTLQNWLGKFDYPLAKNQQFRAGIVHRLDKETSGVMIIAKTPSAFYALQAEFKARIVQKTYLALIHGELKPERGKVEAPVGRLPWNRRRFGVLPGGKPAVTSYQVLKTYRKAGQAFSLVEAYPKTGRTHQIRIHMKYLNSPIVSDQFYAGRKTSRQDRKWCPRLFLHAKAIEFKHPKTDKTVKFESGLPADLQKCLNQLG